MEATGDNALAERLRREDPEQFHTLVRMHLSFVLDLNTDDYLSESHVSAIHCPGIVLHVLSCIWKDSYCCMQSLQTSQSEQHASSIERVRCECSSEKAKSRLQKWGFVPFSKKGKCAVKGVMEGAPLTQEGICQVYQLIEFLSKEQNISQEGIFRRSGKITRQQELKSLLNQGLPLNLDDGHFSVHDCASVLKNFLAELPESLLTDAHYPAYCQIAEMCGGTPGSSDQPSGRNSESRLLRALQLLFLLLPIENRVLLKDILQLLHLTASHEGKNKMSAESLATLFTPHLLCPRKLSPEAIHVNSQTMSGVIAFMIQQGTTLFNIPPKLATDIRAYLVEWERRKLPPKKELNESVCDGTAANTIFTFVDRERTALAHVVNPTEAALAQLYAHIQSLPESSKKKKLIKQFNKENGQGTPLQVNMRRKNHLRSKSLGDSIKKHIFHKGTKQQKSNNTQSQFNGSRSLSQEMINKHGTCMKLFQKSMEEDSHSYVNQDEMPRMHKSRISSTNCVPLQLQCTMLNNSKPERHSDSSNNKDIQGREYHPPVLSHHVRMASHLPRLLAVLQTSTCLPRPILHPHLASHCLRTKETMMTPRCRKPVVLLSGSNLCHLANISTLGTGQKHFCQDGNGDSYNSIAEDKETVNNKEDCPMGSCSTSYSMEYVAVKTLGNNAIHVQTLVEDEGENEDFKTAEICSASSKYMPSDSDSLTSTFRSYLLNRSVVTASPVDLSFSSRTGDFDTSESNNEEKILGRETLSTSLLYCLDGNQPSISSVTDEQVNDVYGSCCDGSRDSGTLLKEQLVQDAPRVCEINLQSCSASEKDNGKICEVTSKATLISDSEQFSKNIIYETSL